MYNNQPKVSVIIPVYNVEKYLRKCLDSVINQTYKNLEIICINDGSPDNSLAILEEYALKDERIIVINQENAGVSAARNAGLDRATGEYIVFVDSDDWVEPKCYELVIDTVLTNPDVELIQWGANIINERKVSYAEYDIAARWYSPRFKDIQALSPEIIVGLLYSPCTNLFKRSIIEELNLRYKNYKVWEDVLFISMYLARVKHIYFMQQKLYNYLLSIPSATKRYGVKNNPLYSLNAICKELIECLDFYTKIQETKRFQQLIFLRFKASIMYCLSYIKDATEAIEILENMVNKIPTNLFLGNEIEYIRHKQYNRIARIKLPYLNYGNKILGIKIFKGSNPLLILMLLGIRFNIHYQKLLSVKNTNKHKVFNFFGIKFKVKRKNPNDAIEQQNILLKNHITNEIFAANIIKEVHSKTFPKFKNCNSNKNVIMVACGPSMAYYKQIQDAVHIGVNKSYQNKQLNLDYLFFQDYNAVKEIINEIIEYPAEKFIGTFLTKDYNWISGCCIPEQYRNTPGINLYFSDYPRNLGYPYLECCGLMDYTSVVFPAMQFALYTHPKRIYLVGCDCSYAGYFDGSKQNSAGDMTRLLKPWKDFKQYWQTYYPDVEIISINPVNLKGLFKDVYTKNYLSDNPEIDRDNIEIILNSETEVLDV